MTLFLLKKFFYIVVLCIFVHRDAVEFLRIMFRTIQARSFRYITKNDLPGDLYSVENEKEDETDPDFAEEGWRRTLTELALPKRKSKYLRSQEARKEAAEGEMVSTLLAVKKYCFIL